MIKELQMVLPPEVAGEDHLLQNEIASVIGADRSELTSYEILRKSIDARHGKIRINLRIRAYLGEHPAQEDTGSFEFRQVQHAKPVIIVGSGPAGLFAALRLIGLGLKPVILERGNEVSERKKDIARISTEQTLNPESNYSFGEGGAGTFSDGKLYTRSLKRGNVDRILRLFRYHGADASILYEAHPHIGTDKLPEIIKKIRETILGCGGEIHFKSKVTDILTSGNKIRGVVTASGLKFMADAVVLATGHSARDIYNLLAGKNMILEGKPFAMGVRVEHPQELINQIQYHTRIKNRYLPAAIYNVVTQVQGRGVYSFCMCPGGYIVPAATSADETVVNGMSSSRRHTPYANSGIVVEIQRDDLKVWQSHGALAGLFYQQHLERLAREHGGSGQIAPAQRLTDFVSGRVSGNLPSCSYTPGIISSPLHSWLPPEIAKRLQEGFLRFDKKMRGFFTDQAVIAGVESRTSSPVRIPRFPDTLQHPGMEGLYPCGEGAGYAGGIVSSAMDGETVAERVAAFLK